MKCPTCDQIVKPKKVTWHKARRHVDFPWTVEEGLCGLSSYWVKNEWKGVNCKDCLAKKKSS